MIEKDRTVPRTPVQNSKSTLIGYVFMAAVFIGSALIGAFAPAAEVETNNLRSFTLEELAQFDGKDGAPTYVAYDGLIYDVSESALFQEGEHFGHLSGQDLTAAMAEAPHADEVFVGFEVVGQLASDDAHVSTTSERRQRFLLFGKTMTAWSGYLFAVVFILNFMTCYVMPWCASSVPWKGTIPGPDKWDHSIIRLSYYHRYLAWATIILGIIHGVLGIFQSFGIIV
jgi:predicted heme/steroid binding protein